MAALRAVIFDLGGVLIDWDPRYLYRQILEDEAAIDDFLDRVCTQDWNREQDRGRSVAEATAERVALFPEHREAIEAFYGRWEEMLGGAVAGAEQLLEDVCASGTPVFALSNWSAETFVHATRRFAFLDRFEDILVSGREGVIKPEPAIYELALERFGLGAEQAVFFDDVVENVEAASRSGLIGLHFTSAVQARRALQELGVVS